MNQFNIPYIFNPGILSGVLPEKLLNKVREVVNDPKSKSTKSMTEDLVASIREEYETPEIPGFKLYIHEMYDTWKKTYRVPDTPYKIGPIWTNYMKAGEFNPNHMHPSALAVFVLWVNIPFDINAEVTFNNYNNREYPAKNSCFEFTYSTYDGRILNATIYVTKEMEGTITMFPSTMMHCAYPFYSSDGERISIAGNIYQQ